MSKVTFPASHTLKNHYTEEYKKWWEQVHGSYLEDNIQKLTSHHAASKGMESLPRPKKKPPKSLKNIENLSKGEVGPSSNHDSTKEKASTSSKRKESSPIQEDSSSSKDHCWKRTKVDTKEPKHHKNLKDVVSTIQPLFI